MAEQQTVRRAEPVKIEHTARSVDALEWSAVTSATGRPTIVLAVEGDIADVAGPLAEKLMDRNRVIGVVLKSKWDPVTIAWWAADPVVVVAQGAACRVACETARLAPGALRALVLADCIPRKAAGGQYGLAVPVLVFQGRESSAGTHAQAVRLSDDIVGSHLIELDDCAELPTKNCATTLAESLTWFLDELGKPFMEFDKFAGSGKKPVDPKA
ncbi:MAG: hypothetical protein O3B04_02570 [Chloroflexi bacterium]|nr:hypothetical protein [Chloroflexota bacterium]